MMDRKERLETQIANLRNEQQKLQFERIMLGGGFDIQGHGERESHWCKERLQELRDKTLPDMDKVIVSLNTEKSYLLEEVGKVHAELDRISSLRSDLKERRQEQQMLFNSNVVSLKQGIAALNRDILTVLREENVPETTIVRVIQHSLQSTGPARLNNLVLPPKSGKE